MLSPSTQRNPWSRLRDLLIHSADRRSVIIASALGAAVGVAPIPGFQVLLLGALAFRMRFHLPLALVVMNIGFGPLFLLWGTLEVVCGAWLRSGCDPFTRWQEVRVLFANPLVDLSTFVFSLLGDWLLGCMLVVPVVAALAAISTWMAIRWYDRMRLRF